MVIVQPVVQIPAQPITFLYDNFAAPVENLAVWNGAATSTLPAPAFPGGGTVTAVIASGTSHDVFFQSLWHLRSDRRLAMPEAC